MEDVSPTCCILGSIAIATTERLLNTLAHQTGDEPMQLNERQKKHLRGLAHGRDPIVMVGQSGGSEGVLKELDIALGAHELVKVKARVGDRTERDELLEQLAQQTSSALVQRIGNVGVFYRPRKDNPKIILPD